MPEIVSVLAKLILEAIARQSSAQDNTWCVENMPATIATKL